MKTKTKPKAKSWFEFRNALGGRAEIAIMDEIGAYGITAGDFKDALGEIPPTQPILLHICSDGGSIPDGIEIYNTLRAHPGGVEVEIGALAASISSLIAMAGNPVTMPDNGFMMIHKPTVVTIGDSDDHRANADTMDKMQNVIAETYAKKTGKLVSDISAMMDDETWMTADEALENGFIDSIREENDDSYANYVNFNLSKFKNSANFALRLQKQNDPAKELAGGKGGDTSASVKLSDLEEAAGYKPKNAVTPDQPTTLPKEKPTMTAEEIEQKRIREENARLIAEGVRKGIEAQNKLHGEIDAAVAQIIKRDKKDFSNAAGKIKQNGGTLDDFYKVVATSDDFKPVDVVGSGEEHVVIVDEFRGRNVSKGSPGEQFVNSEAYRDARLRGGRSKNASTETTNFSNALAAGGLTLQPTTQKSGDGTMVTGFRNAVTDSGLISQQDIPGVYQLGVRQLKVKDVLLGGVTNSIAIRYIKETAFTNAATTVAEGAAKPYGTVTVQQLTAPVQKIAALIKVTDELWADFPAVASLINTRLPYMVERTEEDQLLNGDGTGSNLSGLILNAGQTQAVGADTQVDAIFKAGMKCMQGPGLQTGGYPWDYTMINPISWQSIRLTKDANNQYFAGGPFTGAYGNGGFVTTDSLWGRPVVVTPAIAPGTALVGSRLAAQYFMRMGLMLESTNSNVDDFEKNLVTLRGEERLVLIVPLPLGLVTVTGLATS